MKLICTLLLTEGYGGTKTGAYSLRQATYGSKKEREGVGTTVSSTTLLKMKDQWKEITVPSYCPPPGKTEDYGNPIRSSCSSMERAKEKEKGISVLLVDILEKWRLGRKFSILLAAHLKKERTGRRFSKLLAAQLRKQKS
ncbi:uncharacterized protein Fot_57116 [Forsythia ovata]|uniref:Uncharacterized protein n=1 Tax=Forsythia ovata TaxID=205694 RepID=A0ABD1NYN9_9LAMI